MGKVDRFEDLRCWQEARRLTNAVYGLTKKGQLSKDFALRDQFRSAAVSSMSNIAEGFHRFHKREFIRFLDISQSSAAEVKSLLYVVLDQKYAPEDEVHDLQGQAESAGKTTSGLIRYLHRQQGTGKVTESRVEYDATEILVVPIDLPSKHTQDGETMR